MQEHDRPYSYSTRLRVNVKCSKLTKKCQKEIRDRDVTTVSLSRRRDVYLLSLYRPLRFACFLNFVALSLTRFPSIGPCPPSCLPLHVLGFIQLPAVCSLHPVHRHQLCLHSTYKYQDQASTLISLNTNFVLLPRSWRCTFKWHDQ